jgi:CPA2 family monovalent cation:H+ antiporter-2
MPVESDLLATIAGGLVAAFIGGYIARRLGLPPIVGYLVAGVAIGPFTPGFVADQEVATQLAELGVILLMFGVGLHFSLRDLWAVRGIALPGAVGQIVVATLLGTVIGIAIGWGVVAGVILGLALSVASTVVLLRALMERRELDTTHGRVAVGWLIVEDIFTVLVLVILPALAIAQDGATSPGTAVVEVAIALGKAAVLAVLMFVVGARLLPRLLLSVARDGSRELFTLAVLATAIGIAFVSYAIFGVSLALGAFLAGAVLAESDLSHQAAFDALPLRDAFAVLFFVSVGMLVDPAFLVSHPIEIVAVVALVVLGKSIAALAIVLIAGYPTRTGLTVAAGLAQVGEFTFILAALGTQLGYLPPEGFQLSVAAAILSITLNPAAFALSDRIEPQIREHPLVAWLRTRRARDLTTLPSPLIEHAGRRHAVLVGHGRVGSLVARALERRGFAYVVIEQDRRIVEALRGRGIPALYGDAADPELLARAGIDHAVVLVVAVADPAASEVIYERARKAEPRLEIVVRTNADRTAARLASEARAWPVVGERELAIQMARVALRRFGVSGTEVEAIAQGIRSIPPGPPPGGSPGGGRQSRSSRMTAVRSRLVRPAAPRATGSDPASDAGSPSAPEVVDPAPIVADPS